MNALRKSLSNHFQDAYTEKDFYTRYLKVYFLALIIGVGCLIWSAFASFKFYQSYLHTFDSQFRNNALAGFLTIFQSIVIGGMVGSVIKDFFRGQWDEMTTIFAVVSIIVMGWNVYCDYQGVPEMALSWTEKPVDTKTEATDNVYQGQIDDAQGDIDRYQNRIAYIKGDCKKEDCWVDGGKAYWKGNLTEFGKRELRKMQTQIEEKDAEISKIRATWNGQRDLNTQEHADEVDKYDEQLSRRTGTLRGIVLILLIVYIGCSIFTGYFGATIRSDQANSQSQSQNKTQAQTQQSQSQGQHSPHQRDKDLELEFLYEELAKLKASMNGSAAKKP